MLICNIQATCGWPMRKHSSESRRYSKSSSKDCNCDWWSKTIPCFIGTLSPPSESREYKSQVLASVSNAQVYAGFGLPLRIR